MHGNRDRMYTEDELNLRSRIDLNSSANRRNCEWVLKQASDSLDKLTTEDLVEDRCKLGVDGPPVKCVKRAVLDVLETQVEAKTLADIMYIYLRDEVYTDRSRKEDLVMKFRFLEYKYGEAWSTATDTSGVDCVTLRLQTEMKFFDNPRLNLAFDDVMSKLKPGLARRISSYVDDPFQCSFYLCYLRTSVGARVIQIDHLKNSPSIQQLFIFVFWTTFFKKLATDIAIST